MKKNSAERLFNIGIDLGGTKTEAIVIDSADKVLFRERIATPRQSYAEILNGIAHMISQAEASVPAQAGCTIGMGIPGSINSETGLVQNANTTCLIGRPLQVDIERRIGRAVAIDNDANCFTLAECRAGAGRGYGLVFGIIMGTGCGGGICIDGKVWRGPHHIAGEWGHFPVDPQGAQCYCGNRGCIETKISGGGVEAAFYTHYGRIISMQSIVRGYRSDDPECTEALQKFLDDFSRCLGGLVSILDPDAIVLGGGLSNIDELYTIGAKKMRAYAFHGNLKTPVLKNTLGDSAGVYGAAWLGAQAAHNS